MRSKSNPFLVFLWKPMFIILYSMLHFILRTVMSYDKVPHPWFLLRKFFSTLIIIYVFISSCIIRHRLKINIHQIKYNFRMVLVRVPIFIPLTSFSNSLCDRTTDFIASYLVTCREGLTSYVFRETLLNIRVLSLLNSIRISFLFSILKTFLHTITIYVIGTVAQCRWNWVFQLFNSILHQFGNVWISFSNDNHCLTHVL